MKTLVISAAFPPMKAGESDHAYHISEQLAQKGMDVHVLTSKGSQPPGNPPFVTHACMTDWSWTDLPRLAKFVRKNRPDVVLLIYIGWIYKDHPMMTFAPTIIKRLLPGCRVITQFEYPMGCNNDKFSIATRVIRRVVERWASPEESHYAYGTLLRDSDAFVVLSDRHRRMLADECPTVDSKAVLIPPPPLLTMAETPSAERRGMLRRKLGFGPQDVVFVYFGYIYPPKGVETLIRAFHNVSRNLAEAKLLLVGGVVAHEYPGRPRFAEEMRRLPGELGIADRVVWSGEFETGSDQPSQYLYASDVGVFPHDLGVYLNNSSFAAVAAHGLPIIATQAEYVESAFVEEENLLFCVPKSAESMSKAMLRVAKDSDLRERLKQGATQLAAQWFSWDMATARVLTVLGAVRSAMTHAA